MEIFYTRKALGEYLQKIRERKLSVGLVPTMGALHQGHLSLIKRARETSDVVVCSIFVNPTQFNDKRDLENYPRPIDSDIKMLESTDCEVLFIPAVEEMYVPGEEWHIDLGGLEHLLEGRIRPGHYQGVTQIVKKLLDATNPDQAFFGQKDYQQFLIISLMVKKLNIPVQLVLCPIVREPSGLAMSSRNVHLSELEKRQALALFQSLTKFKEGFEMNDIELLRNTIVQDLNNSEGIKLEYFEIADAETLHAVDNKDAKHIIALSAAKVGKIRIIDNMIIK